MTLELEEIWFAISLRETLRNHVISIFTYVTLLGGHAICGSLLVARAHASLVLLHQALRVLPGHPWCRLPSLHLCQHWLQFLLHVYPNDKMSEPIREAIAVESKHRIETFITCTFLVPKSILFICLSHLLLVLDALPFSSWRLWAVWGYWLSGTWLPIRCWCDFPAAAPCFWAGSA